MTLGIAKVKLLNQLVPRFPFPVQLGTTIRTEQSLLVESVEEGLPRDWLNQEKLIFETPNRFREDLEKLPRFLQGYPRIQAVRNTPLKVEAAKEQGKGRPNCQMLALQLEHLHESDVIRVKWEGTKSI